MYLVPARAGAMAAIAGAALSVAACQTSVSFPQAAFVGEPHPKLITVSGIIEKPKGTGPFPAVVLLHSCGGFQSHVRSEWPGYLSRNGYIALAVDTYGSRGLSYCPNGTGPADFIHDAYGALDYLARQKDVAADRIAVMGFSAGAIAIDQFLLSLSPRIDSGARFRAAILMYGTCDSANQSATKDKIPVLAVVGERDLRFRRDCEWVEKFSNGAKTLEVHVIPGAYHAFDSPEASGHTDPGGNYMVYDIGATEAAERIVRDFLRRQLAP